MESTGVLRSSRLNNGWLLFAIILAANIIQSVFTPLINDEPYYWLYAQYPAWGYFDHPPMISFLIMVAGAIFPDAIAGRLLCSLIGSFTFILVYKIIAGETDKPVNIKLAALLLFSSLFLNIYSFIVIPDTPLLFFAALFLYVYRRYINNDTILNALLLGVVTVLLLYTKYHGVLLIFFTLLSNIKLIFRRSFYLVFIVAVILFIPHIYWQIQHDYPTIRFQLLERASEFKAQHVFSYIGEQAAVTGPLVLLVLSILYRPQNQFQKTLKYNVIGVFAFFFISSFKDMVNMHWTGIAWPAMLCLAYLYITQLKTKRKFITVLLTVNLVLIIVLRINFMCNAFPLSNFNDRNPEVMTKMLQEKAKDYPLVFKDMYNEPSYYMFYGHQKAYAFNTIWYKKTQFNNLPELERDFQNKAVGLVTRDSVNASSEKVPVPKGKDYYITVIPNFTSYNTTIKVKAEKFADMKASSESKVKVSVESLLTDSARALFKAKGGYILLSLTNKKTNEVFYSKYNGQSDLTNKGVFDFTFTAPAQKGEYRAVFSALTGDSFLIGFNSNTYNCKVE